MEHSSKVHKRVVNNFLGNINHFYHYEGSVTYNGTVNYNAENGGRQQDWAEAEEAEFEEAADLAPVKAAGETADEEQDYSAAVGKCFRNTSAFVREKVKEAVEKYYRGVAANLTLIEVTLFDHCLIYKRNSHTPLVRSLIAWGILGKMSEVEVKKLSNLMASKYQEIPKGGYKVWDKYHENDKTLCADIGANLGPTIPYRIELGK